jgi:hypothetical protein
MPLVYTNLGGANLGGGPYNGFSPVQTHDNYKDSNDVIGRRIVVKSWNGRAAAGQIQGNGGVIYNRTIGPFRAINNAGDFLARWQYVCGGPNAIGRYRTGMYIRSGLTPPNNTCDGTGVEGASCNSAYVYDSSDYIRFKKLRAMNQNYNDLANGGFTNSNYVEQLAVTGGNRRVVP